jgi:hypothetical protein
VAKQLMTDTFANWDDNRLEQTLMRARSMGVSLPAVEEELRRRQQGRAADEFNLSKLIAEAQTAGTNQTLAEERLTQLRQKPGLDAAARTDRNNQWQQTHDLAVRRATSADLRANQARDDTLAYRKAMQDARQAEIGLRRQQFQAAQGNRNADAEAASKRQAVDAFQALQRHSYTLSQQIDEILKPVGGKTATDEDYQQAKLLPPTDRARPIIDARINATARAKALMERKASIDAMLDKAIPNIGGMVAPTSQPASAPASAPAADTWTDVRGRPEMEIARQIAEDEPTVEPQAPAPRPVPASQPEAPAPDPRIQELIALARAGSDTAARKLAQLGVAF